MNLELIEQSIHRIPLNRDEFEAQLGVSTFSSSSHNNNNDDVVVYRFSGNLSRIICDEKKNRKKKNLRTFIQKWIEKWNRKEKRMAKFLPVNGMGTNDATTGTSNDNSKNSTNPRILLDQYVQRVSVVKNDTTTTTTTTDKKQEQQLQQHVHMQDNKEEDTTNNLMMGSGLLLERTPETSLAVYRPNGVLYEGEISSSSDNSPTTRVALLKCSSLLYYQLWYFRTIQAKDTSRAYGFVVTTSTNTTTTHQQLLSVSLIILEKPSTGPIGCPYTLYEYNQQCEVGSNNKEACLLDDLGHFILTSNIPSPMVQETTAANLLQHHHTSPGFMLLPCQHLLLSSALSAESRSRSSGWQVISTITGSLVIRCENAEMVRKLLLLDKEEENHDDHNNSMSTFVADFEKVVVAAAALQDDKEEDDDDDDGIWYVKYKTPSFGPFWDTSKLAINTTRNMIANNKQFQQQSSTSLSSTKGNTQATTTTTINNKGWFMYIYPIDSLITKNRSITIMRSVGEDKLEVLLGGRRRRSSSSSSSSSSFQQISSSSSTWNEFQIEFVSLMKRTLHFQSTYNLIHGDINEGNILYSSTAQKGYKLNLIDWDEALRNQPCHRKISSWEERSRYPTELISFPEQYTKQQFMHLFQTIARKYYYNYYYQEMGTVAANNICSILSHGLEDEQQQLQDEGRSSFLSRTAVDARFKVLIRSIASS